MKEKFRLNSGNGGLNYQKRIIQNLNKSQEESNELNKEMNYIMQRIHDQEKHSDSDSEETTVLSGYLRKQ